MRTITNSYFSKYSETVARQDSKSRHKNHNMISFSPPSGTCGETVMNMHRPDTSKFMGQGFSGINAYAYIHDNSRIAQRFIEDVNGAFFVQAKKNGGEVKMLTIKYIDYRSFVAKLYKELTPIVEYILSYNLHLIPIEDLRKYRYDYYKYIARHLTASMMKSIRHGLERDDYVNIMVGCTHVYDDNRMLHLWQWYRQWQYNSGTIEAYYKFISKYAPAINEGSCETRLRFLQIFSRIFGVFMRGVSSYTDIIQLGAVAFHPAWLDMTIPDRVGKYLIKAPKGLYAYFADDSDGLRPGDMEYDLTIRLIVDPTWDNYVKLLDNLIEWSRIKDMIIEKGEVGNGGEDYKRNLFLPYSFRGTLNVLETLKGDISSEDMEIRVNEAIKYSYSLFKS